MTKEDDETAQKRRQDAYNKWLETQDVEEETADI